MRNTILILGASLVILAACETATPYSPSGENSNYGFSEQQIENNRFRVTFNGNSLTSRETVENYLLFRAAELTRERGFDYFVVVKDDTEKETRYYSTGTPYPDYYGYGRPFPYYGYGYGFGRRGFEDGDYRESVRYSAMAYIQMFSGEKPNSATAYDADEVIANLGPKVVRPSIQ